MRYGVGTILKESIPVLTIGLAIAVMAGQLLQMEQESLVLFPFLLAFFPILNGVGGNLGSILGSRITSGLHVGYIPPRLSGSELWKNIFINLLLGIITYIALVISSYWIFPAMGVEVNVSIWKFSTILLISATLLMFSLAVISVGVSLVSFKRGVDPDNVVIPLVTSLGDLLGIVFLTIAMRVVGL